MMINPKAEILKLKNDRSWNWPESDYGKATIQRKDDMLLLFEIPMFGGEPHFYKSYPIDQIDSLIKTVQSWA